MDNSQKGKTGKRTRKHVGKDTSEKETTEK